MSSGESRHYKVLFNIYDTFALPSRQARRAMCTNWCNGSGRQTRPVGRHRVHRLMQWESPARLRTAEERLGKKQQRAVQ